MKGFKANFDNFLKNKKEDKEFKDTHYYLHQETLSGILDIQKEKERLITTMHTLLEQVDNGQEIAFSDRGKKIEVEGDTMYFFKKNGIKEKATKGDIMVAGINGIDITLTEGIDRNIKKEYILREIKRRIQSLYNQQLIQAELENVNAHPKDLCRDAYEKIKETKNMNPYESEQTGVLAETMIESYLTKLFIDNPLLPFEIEVADVHEDVRSKIDFKLHIKKEYTRGLSVQTHKDAGIQFTMDSNKTDVKKEQIEKSKEYMERLDKKPVDDLILVSFPITEIQESLQSWKNDGKNKSIAGPTEKWSLETKKLVFTKILEKLPPSLHIDTETLWDSIQT